ITTGSGSVTYVNAGAGDDTITQVRNGAGSGVALNGDDDNDQINVRNTTASTATTANGGAGNDTVNVGTNAPNATGGTLDGILGPVGSPLGASNITGGVGADTVFVYLLNAAVNINGGDGSDTVVINGSRLADVFNVTGTSVTVVGSRVIPYINIEKLIL